MRFYNKVSVDENIYQLVIILYVCVCACHVNRRHTMLGNSLSLSLYIYIYIRGAFNKFPGVLYRHLELS